MLVPTVDPKIFLGIVLNLKEEIAPQLRVGAALYQQRTGHWPDKILVSTNLPEIPGIADLGCEIEAHTYVQKHLAYLGTAYNGSGFIVS